MATNVEQFWPEPTTSLSKDRSIHIKRTSQLSQNRKDEIRAIFDRLDTNHDGLIAGQELATLLRTMGQNPTPQELKELEEKCEGTSLSYDFILLIIEEFGLKSLEEEEAELMLAFRAIDKDGSGSISKSELKKYLCLVGDGMSEEEVDEIMDMSDLNKDGVIDYQEFVSVMAAHIM